MIANATLYFGDCLEVLPSLSSIDAIITDPPYCARERVKRASGGRGKPRRGRFVAAKDWPEIAGDDRPFDPTPWVAFKRVVLWGANWYADRLPPGKTRWLVWDKRCGTTSDDNADLEMAWTNLKGPDRIFRHLWRGICRDGEENIGRGQELVHPMQKPANLMRWCLQQAGIVAGMTVLDPYMGSAPVGIACTEIGARYIGIEKIEPYFDVACERVLQATKQQRLFA